jgi:hypothetical protein
LVCLMFSFSATAQLTTKKTIFTINVPMEIPGKPAIVLAPGKYVMRLLDTAVLARSCSSSMRMKANSTRP